MGKFIRDIDADGHKITNLVDPTNAQDVATKNYVDNSGGGVGEVNTASNRGAGEGTYASKVGVDLQFKSLVAGTNISLSSDSNEITIDAPGGASNVTNPMTSNLDADNYDITNIEELGIRTSGDPIGSRLWENDSDNGYFYISSVAGIKMISTSNTQDIEIGTNADLLLNSGDDIELTAPQSIRLETTTSTGGISINSGDNVSIKSQNAPIHIESQGGSSIQFVTTGNMYLDIDGEIKSSFGKDIYFDVQYSAGTEKFRIDAPVFEFWRNYNGGASRVMWNNGSNINIAGNIYAQSLAPINSLYHAIGTSSLPYNDIFANQFRCYNVLYMNNNRIRDVADPVDATDGVNKQYVDNAISGGGATVLFDGDATTNLLTFASNTYKRIKVFIRGSSHGSDVFQYQINQLTSGYDFCYIQTDSGSNATKVTGSSSSYAELPIVSSSNNCAEILILGGIIVGQYTGYTTSGQGLSGGFQQSSASSYINNFQVTNLPSGTKLKILGYTD